MKVDLTDQEKEQLNRELETNKVRHWFLNRENIKFEVGDVLIKNIKQYSSPGEPEKWGVENINSDNKMAQRYVYIYEDENGIGFIKQLRVANGTLGKDIWCMTDFDFSSTRFEVDPEYAEHVLLDADFDIKKIHKASLAARKIIIKMNRKIGRKAATVKQFNQIIESMKVGDTFWLTHDYTGRYLREVVLTSATKIDLAPLMNTDWSWQHLKKHKSALIDDTYSYKIAYKSNYQEIDRSFADSYRDIFFTTQKPALEEKK